MRFDWNRARAFMVAAEVGSFSEAARRLKLSQPTVSRQVAALESELGLTLFERVGHGLALTPAGADLVEQAQIMGEAAEQMALIAAGRSDRVDGDISVSASEIIAAHLLPPIIAKLRAAHPGVNVEIVATNAPSDLRRGEADIAIRNFRPETPDLVVRKVRDSAARLYATPAYLERLGPISSPADLSAATFLGFDRGEALLNGLKALGLPLRLSQFQIVSGSQTTQWAMARAGLGICIMMEEVGEADPLMVQALPSLPAIPVPIWLTAHRELRTSRRIRVVFELLSASLGAF